MSSTARPQPQPLSTAASLFRSRRVHLAALVVLLLATPVFSIAFGAASVPLDQVFGVLADHLGIHPATGMDPITDAIVWQNRMPRIIAGIGVGAVLGVSGVALQAVVRNPLAEPYVLGVSAGASSGAATAIIIVGVSSTLGVAGLAFAGALVATFMVLAIGGRRRSTALTLVLAGLAIGFIFQAVTNLIIFSSDSPETARSVMFWTLGSLAKVGWTQSVWTVVVAAALIAMLWLCAPWLDALASGDATSLSVGINPATIRLTILIPVSAAIGLVVAMAGGIGFVGLVIPHLMRSFTGYRHRTLVISSGLAGAVFLVWADTFSRTVFSPSELPIGVITGLFGAPFLLALVGRMNPAR